MQILPTIQKAWDKVPFVHHDELRVGQLNAHNFFDTVDNPSTQDPIATRADYRTHIAKLSLAITDGMGAPDIITMQEVENQKVLNDLVAEPALAKLGYKALLKEGTDPRGIDNAILYRDTVTLEETMQLDPAAISDKGHSSHLFTRPPLMAKFAINGRADAKRGIKEITVVAAHFTSKLGQEDAAKKRLVQAQTVADFATGLQAIDPKAAVLVSGDLNMEASEPEFAPLRNTRREGSLVSLGQEVAAKDRFSWRDGRKHLMLDHMLASDALAKAVKDVEIPHIDTQSDKSFITDPVRVEGVSDHDPMIATIKL
jgi:predicted extracellular nuclease